MGSSIGFAVKMSSKKADEKVIKENEELKLRLFQLELTHIPNKFENKKNIIIETEKKEDDLSNRTQNYESKRESKPYTIEHYKSESRPIFTPTTNGTVGGSVESGGQAEVIGLQSES
jgi:hypothetical protein